MIEVRSPLAAARERRGITVPILAVASGVAQHVLEAAERDPRALTVEEAARVGVILGVEPGRVLEVPLGDDERDHRRVTESASSSAAEPAWRAAARRAGVNVDAAYPSAA